MADTIQKQAMRDFVRRNAGVGLFSTGANPVNYPGVLYNVSGSSKDPKINNKPWKKLLISHGIDDICYVTNTAPPKAVAPKNSSHLKYKEWLGGHMTQNSDGKVAKGDISYLMPLCPWHNHTARNGFAFTHTHQRMLELEGYMEGDTVATFLARQPSIERFSLAFLEDDRWKYEHLISPDEIKPIKSRAANQPREGDMPFVLFEQIGGQYKIADVGGLDD